MTSRRRFIELVPVAGATLCWGMPAQAQATRLDETDPKAVAVGYVHDGARVDARKYPKYLPGEDCAGCLFYLAKPTEPWGPCSIFPRKLVAAKGWCDAFATRPPPR
jgi:hypothetical protein